MIFLERGFLGNQLHPRSFYRHQKKKGKEEEEEEKGYWRCCRLDITMTGEANDRRGEVDDRSCGVVKKVFVGSELG